MSNGLNDFATNPEIRQALREDFPAHQVIKVPKVQGRPPVDTVSHAVVTDRLNNAAPGWTYEILRFIEVEGIWIKPDAKKRETFEPYNDGQLHLVAVFGSMTIGSVTRYEVGEVDRHSAYGSELKLALSDFIKRAAMRFGVGIGLKSRELIIVQAADVPTSLGAAAVPGSGLQASGGAERPDPISSSKKTQKRPKVQTVELPDDPTVPDDAAPASVRSPDTPPGVIAARLAADPAIEHDLASDEQWERLLKLSDGNMGTAVNRLNRANSTAFTRATARDGATRKELAAALAGDVGA